MSRRRAISWSDALRDMRSDRSHMSVAERRTYLAAEGFARIAKVRAQEHTKRDPLFGAGRFNRRAIMTSAIASARARRIVTGEPWLQCISAALKGAWHVAKAARPKILLCEKSAESSVRTAGKLLANEAPREHVAGNYNSRSAGLSKYSLIHAAVLLSEVFLVEGGELKKNVEVIRSAAE